MGMTTALGEYLARPPRYGIGAAAVQYRAHLPAYIRITDIDEFGRFRPDPAVSVDSPLSRNYLLEDGDLVIARTGASVGKSYRYRSADGELVFAGFLVAIRPDPRRLDPRYLSYFLQSKRYWDWIASESMRSGQPGVNAQQIARLGLDVPTIETQRAVAGLLEDADRIIESLEHLIGKKRDLKQGMMQELLTGRTRIQGFDGDWPKRKLDDLLAYEQPGPYLVSTRQYIEAGSIPVLTAGKTFVLGYTGEAHGIYNSLPVIIFDDFTTASKYVTFPFKAKSSAMKMLSAKAGANLRFMYERIQLIEYSVADHKRRWIAEFSKLEVATPILAEQEAIAAVIENADAEVEALERRLESARAMKTGMMQELLSGLLRLPVEAVS